MKKFSNYINFKFNNYIKFKAKKLNYDSSELTESSIFQSKDNEDCIIINNPTLKLCSEYTDDNGVDIYEGDVVKLYFSVTYEEDGTCNLGNDYIEDIVIYEKGGFKLLNGNYLHEYEPRFEYKIYVVGDVMELKNNKTAIKYRLDSLCSNFDFNKDNIYPEYSDLAFINLAQKAAELPMDDFVCFCDEKENIKYLNILFKLNNKEYLLTQEFSEEKVSELFNLEGKDLKLNNVNFDTILKNF